LQLDNRLPEEVVLQITRYISQHITAAYCICAWHSVPLHHVRLT